MNGKNLLQMVHGLEYKLHNFDIHALLKKCKNGEIDTTQTKKLIDDVYNLEEDLIILDIEKDKG